MFKQPGRHSEKKSIQKRRKSNGVFSKSRSIKQDAVSKSETSQHRFNSTNKRKPKGFLAIAADFFVRNKYIKTNAETAAGEKRSSKKKIRSKYKTFAAAFVILTAAIILTVIIAPWNEADAQPSQTEEQSSAQLEENAAALAQIQKSYDFDTKISSSDIPQVSATPVPTTSPDDIPTPTLEPTPTKEPEPTPTKEPEPTPTTKPEPTPTTKPEPTPTKEPEPTPEPVDLRELADYFMVEADLYYNEAGYSSNHYEYTDEELHVLAQLIQGEAGGESTDGKIAVGNVVMNRVLASGYPGDDIIEVVTASGQFSGYSSSINPSSSCESAARAVLNDEVWKVPQNIYFFHPNKPEGENWGSHVFYTRIGGHNFYSDSYSGRSDSDSRPPALFERTYKWPQLGCKPENRVKRLQLMLNALGYDVYADSYFGKGTKDAIIEFQNEKGLEADGVAGPATLKKLIKQYGIDKYCEEFCD